MSDLLKQINQTLELQLPDTMADEEIRQRLSVYFNHLINTDFQKLIFLLYRLDISESRLQQVLRTHADEDAGLLIAELVMEREKQKIESRKLFGSKPGDDAEEKW